MILEYSLINTSHVTWFQMLLPRVVFWSELFKRLDSMLVKDVFHSNELSIQPNRYWYYTELSIFDNINTKTPSTHYNKTTFVSSLSSHAREFLWKDNTWQQRSKSSHVAAIEFWLNEFCVVHILLSRNEKKKLSISTIPQNRRGCETFLRNP